MDSDTCDIHDDDEEVNNAIISLSWGSSFLEAKKIVDEEFGEK